MSVEPPDLRAGATSAARNSDGWAARIGGVTWTALPIDLESVQEAYSLPEPFHRDPADRLIVAEARRPRAAVVTADSRILEYPHVRTVWDA